MVLWSATLEIRLGGNANELGHADPYSMRRKAVFASQRLVPGIVR